MCIVSDFPCCPVDKNPPCKAGDSVRSLLGELRPPHVAEQLNPCCNYETRLLWSPCATTRESICQNESSHMTQ